jgi:hypothetical protein
MNKKIVRIAKDRFIRLSFALTDASFQFQSEQFLRFDGVFHRQFAENFFFKLSYLQNPHLFDQFVSDFIFLGFKVVARLQI